MENKILESLTILIDTREKKIDHITNYFNVHKIRHRKHKLDFGDFSFEYQINDKVISMESKYSIERKANLEELSNNLAAERARFERELQRAKGSNFILLIENSSYNKMINGKYKTRLNPKSYLMSLNIFMERYGFSTMYLDGQNTTGNYIYYKFKAILQEILKT